MSIRNLSLLLLTALLVTGLCACGGSKYLMKGLTLPPGSTEVSVMDSAHSGMPGGMPAGIGGSVKKSVTVEFNCSGGWGAVTSHFDSFMRGQGYEDSSQMVDSMGQALPGGMKMADMTRSYIKMGDKYAVTVMNNTAMTSLAGGGSLGLSEFTLMVMEFD